MRAAVQLEELEITENELRDLVKVRVKQELLSKMVFQHLNQVATWLTSFPSIPSLNLMPVMTLAR